MTRNKGKGEGLSGSAMWQVLSAVNSLLPALHRTLAAFATEDLTGPVTAADPDNSRRAYNVHQHGPPKFCFTMVANSFCY